MARTADDLLAVAHVLRTHGVAGEVSVHVVAPPVIDAADLLFEHTLSLRLPGAHAPLRELTAESVRPHQDRWLVKFEGVDDMDEAGKLKGHELCIPRADLPPLPEGWYWEADLLLCRVIDAQLGDIGAAGGLDVTGQQPQLIVRRETRAEARIPWVRAYVKKVDLDAAQIEVDLPAEFPGISD